ncbi:hypothetical protein [Thermomonas fusca]|uniref:Uncharacterized protein n=1 Tax=Thermomonas fusca TaxID=215690 RepID=A0A5R9PFW6_9GAMM|nr:hypothetical protein [Thermomonas fusca]TLX21913.1 hypothetical protein E5S66_05090 [Thermomonas fusca]
MTKLAMQQAPPPATPRRFLLSASLWGVVAGMLLAVDGGTAFASRWGGATLALVHALALGVLGNAMFGSLLQFLPVAAGARVRGGRPAAWLLHALLNAGALLLVLALRQPALLSPHWGGLLLVAAFVLLVALVLPGLAGAAGQALLRWGIGCALAGGLVAALLGFSLALAVAGTWRLPLLPLTDAHAGWGVLGWVLALLVAVARVVMPMFQGVAAVPARLQAGWQLALYALLLAALIMALCGESAPALRMGAGLLVLAVALGGLLAQLRAPKLRRAPLTYFWMTGFAALAAAACALLVGGEANQVLAGMLALAIGLPLLVTGMQLEISAFLGWIELQRHCGRGVRLPGVQLLLPTRDKAIVLVLHWLSALALLAATAHPALARLAGSALLLAHAAGFVALCGVDWRRTRFIRGLKEQG